MKIGMMSDTHGRHRNLEDYITPCDIIIAAGDVTMMGSGSEWLEFCEWLTALPAPDKILIAGNHDPEPVAEFNAPGFHYLEDSEVTIQGVKFYGMPWTPRFGQWRWMKSEQDMLEAVAKIPGDVEVLITHGPTRGILDDASDGDDSGAPNHVGCAALAERIPRLSKLRLHIFGHIHEWGGGALSVNNVLMLNVAKNYMSATIEFEGEHARSEASK